MDNFKQIQQLWLSDLCKETGYTVCYQNGQRIYGPPKNLEFRKPQAGSEVYVRGLSKNISEMELLPEFLKIGSIFKSRMMLNFDGTSKGFAYIRYHTPIEAKLAVEQLNGIFISGGGCRIGVYKAFDNRKLWIGCLPISISKDYFKQEIQKHLEGVVDVIMKSSSIGVEDRAAYAFVEFDEHKSAAIGKRNFNVIGELFGQEIKVDWAIPEPHVDPEIMAQVTKLFIGNLPVFLKHFDLYVLCCHLRLHDGFYIKKSRDFAFIEFPNRLSAEDGLQKLQGLVIEGNEIEVSWARPPSYSNQYYTEINHMNYKSVPYIMRRTRNNGVIRNNAESPRPGGNLFQVNLHGDSQVLTEF